MEATNFSHFNVNEGTVKFLKSMASLGHRVKEVRARSIEQMMPRLCGLLSDMRLKASSRLMTIMVLLE